MDEIIDDEKEQKERENKLRNSMKENELQDT